MADCAQQATAAATAAAPSPFYHRSSVPIEEFARHGCCDCVPWQNQQGDRGEALTRYGAGWKLSAARQRECPWRVLPVCFVSTSCGGGWLLACIACPFRSGRGLQLLAEVPREYRQQELSILPALMCGPRDQPRGDGGAVLVCKSLTADFIYCISQVRLWHFQNGKRPRTSLYFEKDPYSGLGL